MFPKVLAARNSPLPASRPGLFVAAALAFSAACGAPGAAPRASVPGVDPVSGELASIDVDLHGLDLSTVRGPAGVALLGASVERGKVVGGATPDCAYRRSVSGAAAPVGARCQGLLGAYAALDRARTFLLSAGAEALPAAALLVEPDLRGPDVAAAGLRYLPAADAFAVAGGPAGARVPLALNPGAVAREAARRQLRTLAEAHPDEANGVALFLGAAAAGDPQFLAGSQPGGDPMGETDLSRPLRPGSDAPTRLAGALWAWAEASGDALAAAKAALAAARALGDRPDAGAGPAALLSLVAGQLDGAERDQACAVFRARLGAAEAVSACP